MAQIRLPKTANSRWLPLCIVVAWSFLEATVFFVVVDVYLSWLALSDRRRALRLCGVAAVSATVGGAILFLLGHSYPQEMKDVLSSIPAIDSQLVAEVEGDVTGRSYGSLFVGAFSGVPYKIFAVVFGERSSGSFDFVYFLVAGLCARLLRFSLVTYVAWMTGRLLRRVAPNSISVAHLAFWVVFYLCYWIE